MLEIPYIAIKGDYLEKVNAGQEMPFLPLTSIIESKIPEGYLQKVPVGEISSLEATLSLLNDLSIRGWKGHISANDGITFTLSLQSATENASKEAIRAMLQPRRWDLISKSAEWIYRNESKIIEHFVDGRDVDAKNIQPVFEICKTQQQHDIFRYCRYLSSVPYSEYVGRRMKFLIRDTNISHRPIIGIAALGSSLLQIKSRDEWIGWNTPSMRAIKKQRLGNLMDLYVCVSLPPYSFLLGGKLICYMMASNWIREAFRQKYEKCYTLGKNRLVKDLVLLVTTNIYGRHSSQYNRVGFNNHQLFIPTGETRGFGTLHVSDKTFSELRNALEQKGFKHSNKFGDGANWRLRVIRDGMNMLGLNADEFLNHGNPRGVFVAPLAYNAREYLRGETDYIEYCDYPLDKMIDFWRRRWLDMRIQNQTVIEQVRCFKSSTLHLTSSLIT